MAPNVGLEASFDNVDDCKEIREKVLLSQRYKGLHNKVMGFPAELSAGVKHKSFMTEQDALVPDIIDLGRI